MVQLAAVGQGNSKWVEGNGNLQKTKNRYQLYFFLFINNVDLKNNNVKNILKFLDARIAAISLFRVDPDQCFQPVGRGGVIVGREQQPQ